MKLIHQNQYARFLGYDVRVRRDNTVKPSGNRKIRTLNYKVELNVPFADKIMPFLFNNAIISQMYNRKIEPRARKYLIRCKDLEIITIYNSELRGICNYYGIASNFIRLDCFAYLMEYNCLKTLTAKHSSTSRKIVDKFRDGKGRWVCHINL